MLLPITKKIIKISQKDLIGFRIYREYLAHIHFENAFSNCLNLLWQLLVDLQYVLASHDKKRRCPFFFVLLPQIAIKTISIDILYLFKFLIFSFLFYLMKQLPY